MSHQKVFVIAIISIIAIFVIVKLITFFLLKKHSIKKHSINNEYGKRSDECPIGWKDLDI